MHIERTNRCNMTCCLDTSRLWRSTKSTVGVMSLLKQRKLDLSTFSRRLKRLRNVSVFKQRGDWCIDLSSRTSETHSSVKKSQMSMMRVHKPTPQVAECASLTKRVLHNSPIQSVTGVWTWVQKKEKILEKLHLLGRTPWGYFSHLWW